jgi:hypothetical protein
MPAFAADLEAMHLPTEKRYPDRVGQFMSENIEPLWARQAKKGNQPEDHTQGKEPEFLRDPKVITEGRARKRGEEGLRQHEGGRNKKQPDDHLHPALRHLPRDDSGDGEIQPPARGIVRDPRTASTLRYPAFHRRSYISLRAPKVGAAARIDLDGLAFLDKERHLHDFASLEGGRLLHVIGAVSPDAFGRLGHLERD